MTEIFNDLRYAARTLGRRPGLVALAIISLALGIGVNSAIFSIVNAVLLRDLPVAEPERLVDVYFSDSGGFQYATSSYPDFVDLRRESGDVFEELTIFEMSVTSWDDGVGTELLFGEEVGGNYFDLLGLEPALGRFFLPEEDVTPGTQPLIVLGHAFWQKRFGGEPGVLGKTPELNGTSFAVIGVAPPEMKGTFPGFRSQLLVEPPGIYACGPRRGLESAVGTLGFSRRSSVGDGSL